MPPKKLKTLPTKQSKDDIRKKVREEIAKNPKNNVKSSKKSSKPKREYHKEFKRLMSLYFEASKVVTSDNLDNIKLAKDELLHHLALNLDKSYSYAFIYMRQLAVTLRQSIADTKKSSIYSIYNWQYLKTLELWTEFIVENASSNENLESLIQPLVQLIVGIIRLRPSARWLPLRFHCINLLNKINYAFKNVTPVLANIIEIFTCVNFNEKTKKDSKKTMNMLLMLHFSTSQLGTFEHLEQTVDQIFQLVVENLAALATSRAFPEYVVLLTAVMRSFVKMCREPMFRDPVRRLVKRIDEHAAFVTKQRTLRPSAATVDRNPVFDDFIDKYRKARLDELETLMKATRHAKFEAPQDDYEDKEKDFNDEQVDDDNDSSDLDEEEFDDDASCDSAVEVEDE